MCSSRTVDRRCHGKPYAGTAGTNRNLDTIRVLLISFATLEVVGDEYRLFCLFWCVSVVRMSVRVGSDHVKGRSVLTLLWFLSIGAGSI